MHQIGLHSLEFDRAPFTGYTSHGVPFQRWARVGMPRIPSNVIDCAFFLYRTVAEAKAGKEAQGTGFLVSMLSKASRAAEHSHYYAITNRHTLEGPNKAPIIRLNRKDGDCDIVPLTTDDWHFLDAGDDVAVASVAIDQGTHKVSLIDISLFATKKWALKNQVGVGDDVFMMGLFIDNEVPSHNVPMARFGNISLMPSNRAPIKQPHGVENGSFILDMHSRSGFSGSPVFMYRTLGSDVEFRPTMEALSTETLFKFIGIHWGQFPEDFTFHRGDKVREYKIKGMSGMSCAIPAWRIKTLLDSHPVIAAQRRAREDLQRQTPGLNAYAWPMGKDGAEYDPYEEPIQQD